MRIIKVICFLAAMVAFILFCLAVVQYLSQNHSESHDGLLLEIQNITTTTNATSTSFVPPSPSPILTFPTDPNSPEYRRQFIRNMTREAWAAYRQYAWGFGTLKPVGRKPDSLIFGKHSGFTILSAMSTLYVMELHEEFKEGKQWIENELKFDQINGEIDVYLAVTQYIGGLLSLYALTGETIFLNKVSQIETILKPAFNSPTGLPYKKLNPKTQQASGKQIELSKIAYRQPELIYLADLTKNENLKSQLNQINQFVEKLEKPSGLFLEQIDVESGKWTANTSEVFRHSLDLYHNIIQSYLQSAGRQTDLLKQLSASIEKILKHKLIQKSPTTGLTYAVKYNVKSKEHGIFMHYTACQLGAILALTEHSLKQIEMNSTKSETYLKLANEITETCHQLANRTKTKLLPSVVEFTNTDADGLILNGGFYLSPELAQSYFILWRLTNETKFRDYAWQLVASLHEHTRSPSGGYSGVLDVNRIPTTKDDYQNGNFLSGTLKYLYLIFSEHSILPLEQWIFTSKGHPLPICGQSEQYLESICVGN